MSVDPSTPVLRTYAQDDKNAEGMSLDPSTPLRYAQDDKNAEGIFITFEGGEGSGKSTQIARFAQALLQAGYGVLEIREPGSNPVSERIRAILLDRVHEELAPRTELMLYEAARAQLTAEVIRPALAVGTVVLCDRFFDSTTAYQGYGRGLAIAEIQNLNLLATGNLVPDRTLVFDLPVEVGLARATSEVLADRLESESFAFHNKVREGFLALAAADPQRFRVIDATPAPERVAQTVKDALHDLFLEL
jgi:dTMP kinase